LSSATTKQSSFVKQKPWPGVTKENDLSSKQTKASAEAMILRIKIAKPLKCHVLTGLEQRALLDDTVQITRIPNVISCN
jgi:hypothetical protein